MSLHFRTSLMSQVGLYIHESKKNLNPVAKSVEEREQKHENKIIISMAGCMEFFSRLHRIPMWIVELVASEIFNYY